MSQDIFKDRIARLTPIGRHNAKYYAQECEVCLEHYKTKEPLFFLDIAHLKNGVVITSSYHIFTLDALNKKLNEFEVKK